MTVPGGSSPLPPAHPPGDIASTPVNAPPTILYHYTDQAGFLGIIETKSIWATNLHYLNDAKEYRLALDLATEFLGSVERERSLSAAEREDLAMLRQHLRQIEEVPIYVASFSASGDRLSQWRAYAKGNGFAIGFDAEAVQRALARYRFTLRPCAYEEDAQLQLIRDVFAQIIDRTRRSSATTRRLELSAGFFTQFFPIAPIIKHRSFREEQEWRAISPVLFGNLPGRDTAARVAVRPGRTVLTPYFDLPLADGNGSFEIAHLVVGPTTHETLAIQGAQMHMKLHDVRCGKVTVSRTPYRDW